MSTTTITILDQLEAGTLDIDQAAERLAAIAWPTRAPAATLADIEADPDPEPEPDNSFALVEQAYCDDRITNDQYAAIVAAIMTRVAPDIA